MACKTFKFKKELLEEVKDSLPYLRSPHLLRKAELCKELDNDCTLLSGYTNDNNSCYIDSFLVAMFHFDNQYIYSNLLHEAPLQLPTSHVAQAIHKELVSAYERLSVRKLPEAASTICKSLRNLLGRYDSIYKKAGHKIEHIDWKSEQQESNDVMQFLMRLYRFPDSDVVCQRRVWGIRGSVRSLITEEQYKTNVADFVVNTDNLDIDTSFDLKRFIKGAKSIIKFGRKQPWTPTGHTESYTQRLEHIKVMSAPLLFIHIARIKQKLDSHDNLRDVRVKTMISAPESIKLKDMRQHLYLRSIIVHQGSTSSGHYTACIMCSGQWYYYDDIKYSGPGSLRRIGDFDKLKSWRNGFAFRYCTNLIYA
jgi:ubiquitin C-terminal hydrolase